MPIYDGTRFAPPVPPARVTLRSSDQKTAVMDRTRSWVWLSSTSVDGPAPDGRPQPQSRRAFTEVLEYASGWL